jgi:hypothetical protein
VGASGLERRQHGSSSGRGWRWSSPPEMNSSGARSSLCQHRLENRLGQCRDRAAQGNGDWLALDLRELASPVRTAALTSANSLDHPLLDHPSLHIARTVRDALADPVARRTIAHPSPGVNRCHRRLEPLGQLRCRKWRALAKSLVRFLDFRRVLGRRALRVRAGPYRGTVPISSFD